MDEGAADEAQNLVREQSIFGEPAPCILAGDRKPKNQIVGLGLEDPINSGELEDKDMFWDTMDESLLQETIS